MYENITSQSLENLFEEHIAHFPEEDDYKYGACVGMVNIELYYSLSGTTFLEIAKGRVKNPLNGKIYQARHTLTSNDFILIAEAAWRGTTCICYLLTYRVFHLRMCFLKGLKMSQNQYVDKKKRQ